MLQWFPLLRREYLSSALHGFKKCSKILHITQRDFFNLIALTVTSKFGKGAVVQISTVFRPAYHVTCRRVLWKGTFYRFIYPLSSESVSSKIHQLWGSCLFWKCSKLNLNFENAKLKVNKTFFVSEIIASENVAINCLC